MTGDSPVYRYHFELRATPSKFHQGTFAFHSDDIEYVFGTLDTRPGWTVSAEDRKLSDEMMSYWTNFAKTGDPNGPGLPKWSVYNVADDDVMEFGDQPSMHNHVNQAGLDFFDAYQATFPKQPTAAGVN